MRDFNGRKVGNAPALVEGAISGKRFAYSLKSTTPAERAAMAVNGVAKNLVLTAPYTARQTAAIFRISPSHLKLCEKKNAQAEADQAGFLRDVVRTHGAESVWTAITEILSEDPSA
jgi:hypothetical protein